MQTVTPMNIKQKNILQLKRTECFNDLKVLHWNNNNNRSSLPIEIHLIWSIFGALNGEQVLFEKSIR